MAFHQPWKFCTHTTTDSRRIESFYVHTDDPTRRQRIRRRRPASRNFIEQIIDADRAAGKNGGRVHTRFPPEPNGYLHIGHAKSICLNFGLAKEFAGKFNLRFDDTNPTKEEQEYVDSIIDDVRWLGGDWEDRLFYASDYFQQLHDWAIQLIKDGKAYVCDLTAEEVREHRGTLTEPGKNSPYRDRSVAENLDLFARMEKGEFPDGARTLRAKIDMASPNVNMRDPVMYRIKHASHHRSGDRWCIYPSYDYTHGQSDSIEGHHPLDLHARVRESPAALRLVLRRPEDSSSAANRIRPAQSHLHRDEQAEAARAGAGQACRRLGRPADAHDSRPPPPRLHAGGDAGLLRANRRRQVQQHDRHGLARRRDPHRPQRPRPRAMAVLRPLKVVIENYPEDKIEELDAANHPQNPSLGTRVVPFSRDLYVEADDFMENAPKGFFRLKPGGEVRLRYAYFITCTDVVKDAAGDVVELRCKYDPATRGGNAPDGRKVKGTIHWVSAKHAPLGHGPALRSLVQNRISR